MRRTSHMHTMTPVLSPAADVFVVGLVRYAADLLFQWRSCRISLQVTERDTQHLKCFLKGKHGFMFSPEHFTMKSPWLLFPVAIDITTQLNIQILSNGVFPLHSSSQVLFH